MDAVSVRGVSKDFDSKRAVDDLSFDVPAGSIFGLLGPNGAGKTTMIRMILKILLPDTGTVRILGRELDEDGKKRVGYLPEERGLYKGMRVGEHLAFLGALRGLSLGDARVRAQRWLARFDAADWYGRRIQELSKGMQQKVQFIGTILHDPDLVILDEPFSGLDPVNARLLKDVMLELRDQGRTVIFSTHQMEQVEKSCDRILLIHKGRAVIHGLLAQIRQEHGGNTVHLEYSGELPVETIKPFAEWIDDHGQYAEIRLRRPEDAGLLLRSIVHFVDIRRFEMSEASLEEIYIRLVEGTR